MSDWIVECLDDWIPDPDGLVAFMKAYIDRGQRPDADGIMSIGCALYKSTPYKQFVRRWNGHLRELDNAPYIHATDFYGGGGVYRELGLSKERRDRVAAKLPATIRKHAEATVVVSFKADEFEAVAGHMWKGRFGTLYTTAVQVAMGAIGHWANFRNYKGRITYFYEDGDQEGPELAKRLSELAPHIKEHTRMLTHAPLPKGSARGLEVADVLSWQWNKFYAESLARDGRPDERAVRKDFRALFDHGQGPRPRVFLFTGDELEYFLNRLWDPDGTPERTTIERPSIQKKILAQLMGRPSTEYQWDPW